MPANLLVELIDVTGGVIMSQLVPFDNEVIGQDLVLVARGEMFPCRKVVIAKIRCSAGRHELILNLSYPIRLSPEDSYKVDFKAATNEWGSPSLTETVLVRR
jgi:hypothetical protein